VENRRYMPLGATAKFRAARFRSVVLGVGPQGLYGISTNQRRRPWRGHARPVSASKQKDRREGGLSVALIGEL